jgi:acetyl esterase
MMLPKVAGACAIFLAWCVAAAVAAQPTSQPTTRQVETTPLEIPGSEAVVYRRVGETELRLHVVRPKDWTKSDRRPAMVFFFGGGWNRGTPRNSVPWAAWAAELGMVGIAPDYRTRDRFGGTPEDCVADGRAAVRWVVENAESLGIDPARIVVGGSSAGGTLAAWAAIPTPGPGANDPAVGVSPAALFLINPVTNTRAGETGEARRFGGDEARALAFSVLHQMPAKMPPTILFHGTADTVVPYSTAVALRDRLVASGNRCELVTFEGGGHSFFSSQFGEAGRAALQRVRSEGRAFLDSLGLSGTAPLPPSDRP